MLKKKLAILTYLFFSSVFLISCGKGTANKESNVLEVIKKYDENGDYEIDREIKVIEKNSPIEFNVMQKTNKDILIFSDFERPEGYKDISYVPVDIFTDYSLKNSIRTMNVRVKRKDGKIVISPEEIKQVYDPNLDNPVKINLLNKSNWGLYKYLYVVQYNDLSTGKLLKKPKIMTYVINNENDKIKAPIVNKSISSNGSLQLSWDKVENATKYYIIADRFEVNSRASKENENKYMNSTVIIGETNGTTWSSVKGDEFAAVNMELVNGDVILEDDAYRDLEKNLGNNINKKNYPILSSLTVIASDGTEFSKLSNFISLADVVPNLPRSIARYTLQKDFPGKYKSAIYEKISEMPTSIPISMCDGKIKYLPFEIKLNELKFDRFKRLNIPLKVKGTPFVYSVAIENPPSDYKEQLQALSKKVEKENLTGSVKEFNLQEKVDISLKSKVVSNRVPEVKDKIFATTSLGYYISANLIDNVDIIDLEAFKEAKDTALLKDTLMEAYYQNPTVSMLEGYNISPDGRYLEILYFEKDRNKRLEKQEEIRKKLDKISDDIKNSSKDPLEQVRKINTFVCENGEYDFDAFNHTEELKKTFKPFDGKYENSYSTYGVSVLNKGVCISYARTFDYLAKKIGLESIVTTGYVNGSPQSGHAWNAVKINGEWKYFDSTWNDGAANKEDYFNLKMNESVFSKTHTLDEDYIVKKEISKFINK